MGGFHQYLDPGAPQDLGDAAHRRGPILQVRTGYRIE
jgi:hypothetical protein